MMSSNEIIYFELQMGFAVSIFLSQINIYETLYPGAIRRIWAADQHGRWTLIWQTNQLQYFTTSRIFSPNVSVL